MKRRKKEKTKEEILKTEKKKRNGGRVQILYLQSIKVHILYGIWWARLNLALSQLHPRFENWLSGLDFDPLIYFLDII